MLESTEKGGIRNSIRNCLTVFQNDPLLSGAIAKNLLTERTDIIKPIGYHRTGTAITDTDMNYLLLYLEETYGLTSEKKIAAAIGIAANENGYHPIRDYLNGLSWDGTERIRTCLHHFLGADSDQYTYEALRLFLLGAIHRAFHPGCKFEVMLCLVGGQGAGKSTFFRRSIKSHTKPTRRTGCGNACSAALPMPLTSCPLTDPATGAFCRSWCTRNRRKFTFWRMKPLPEPTLSSYGRKP